MAVRQRADCSVEAAACGLQRPQALDDRRVTVVAGVDLNGGDIAVYLLHELE